MNKFLKRFIIMSFLSHIGMSYTQNPTLVAAYKPNIEASDFNDFIKKAEADKAIKDYFNASETAHVKLTSKDKISLDAFLKTTHTVFGKILINKDIQLTNYTSVDFNVMYSANIILVHIQEVSNNIILKNTSIKVNY